MEVHIYEAGAFRWGVLKLTPQELLSPSTVVPTLPWDLILDAECPTMRSLCLPEVVFRESGPRKKDNVADGEGGVLMSSWDSTQDYSYDRRGLCLTPGAVQSVVSELCVCELFVINPGQYQSDTEMTYRCCWNSVLRGLWREQVSCT